MISKSLSFVENFHSIQRKVKATTQSPVTNGQLVNTTTKKSMHQTINSTDMFNKTTNKTNGENLLYRTMDILYTEKNFILIIFI